MALSEIDLAISKRAREVREKIGLPRVAVARKLGIDSSRIANYEHGRAAVPVWYARLLGEQFRISSYWLATGIEPIFQYIPLFYGETDEKKPLSKVIDLLKAVADLEYEAFQDRLASDYYDANPDSYFDFESYDFDPSKPGTTSTELLTHINNLYLGYLKSTPPSLYPGFFAAAVDGVEGFLFGNARKIKEAGLDLPPFPMYGKNWEEIPVDMLPEMVNSDGVTSESTSLYSHLLGEVQFLCGERGVKTRLARHLDCTPAQVSRWLSGSVIPNGEVTLRLLEWARQEKQRQKGAKGARQRSLGSEPKQPKNEQTKSSGSGTP